MSTVLLPPGVNPTVLNRYININILEPGTNSALLGKVWQFYLLIKVQRRYQTHDQHQRSSIIDNKMLHSDRSLIHFRIQSQGCKPGKETISKCQETHPVLYNN